MLRNNSGNVGLIFGLSLVPALMLLGIAIDYGSVITSRTQFQNALDAAALAALAEGTSENQREQVAEAAFRASLPESLRALSPTFSITINGAPGQQTATATYTASLPLNFAGIVGQESLSVSGETSTGVVIGGAMDIALWLDASASMGMAASETDRNKMRSLTGGCAFACHMPNGGTISLNIARANNVRLRIDVMKDDLVQMINEIQEVAVPGQRVRYRIAGMSRDLEPRLAWTDNVTTVRNAVQNFTLSGTVHNGWNSASRLSIALNTGKSTLPAMGGDGTADNPRNFVVIVTDGMQFDWNRVSSGPISQATCTDLKNRGISVAVVQLRYVDLSGDGAFDYYVRPHFNQLGPALEQCASPGMYFAGDSPEQIRQAFAELAERIRGALRLTH